MKRPFLPSSKKSKGFTLLEILTATVIFALLAAMLARIISDTQKSTTLSNRMVDAAAQARLAFDRIGQDLGMAIKRPDADFRTQSSLAAVEAPRPFIFFSAITSPSPDSSTNRGVSVIAYRVDAHPDNKDRPCLLRAGRPLGWDTSSTSFMGLKADGLPIRLDSSDPLISQALLPQDNDFDILAPGIVAAAVGYQLYPDNNPVLLADGTIIPKAQGQIVYSPPDRNTAPPASGCVDLKRISALVVGVAALDLRTLSLIDKDAAKSLTSTFPAPNESNKPPVQFWMERTSNLTSFPENVPMPARQAVRLFQRFYPLHPYGETSL